MKEIESLIKRAKRYIKSAEILLKEGDYESTVSRTYYAMFYSAQAILLTKNLSYSSHRASSLPSANISLKPAFSQKRWAESLIEPLKNGR